MLRTTNRACGETLGPCLIRMYLGIQYANSWSVLPSFSNHFSSSSALSISNWVLPSLGQSRRWAAVSRLPQLGHLLSCPGIPKYLPTCTLVPQKPEFCFDLQILYMSGLVFIASSRCSQSTSSNCSFGHGFLFLLPKYRLATSLLVWNLIGLDTSSVILFPQITTAMSSLGRSYVGLLW